MIYFVILILLLYCIYRYDYLRNTLWDSISYWGFFVVLVLVAGLRFRIGNDSVVYENAYPNFPTIFELFSFDYSSTRFEPGFIIFSSIPRTFSPDFVWLQFLEAIVVNFVIFWFIKNNTKNRYFCLTIYYIALFLYFNTEIMREALSVSLFLLAWPSFLRGKWINYYLLVLLAFFFHTSAILLFFLPICYLPGIRGFFKFGYRSWFVCIGCFLIGILLQLKFYDLINNIALTERMAERSDTYSKSELGGGLLNLFGMVDVFVRYILYVLLALYIWHGVNRKIKLNKDEKNYNDRLEFMAMWQIYSALLGLSIFIFLRYTNYFSMFGYILMADVFLGKINYKNKLKRLRPLYWSLIFTPLFLADIYFYYQPVNKSRTIRYYAKYYPYSSRLNPERDKTREAAFRYYGTR